MRIATWNVNSIRARKERLLAWLEAAKPDVACLQETKVVDEDFPYDEVRALGYDVAHVGQKTYNGVAILSKRPLTDVERGLGDGAEDPQSRFIAATVDGVRVWSCYVPNGEAPGTEKFAYKMKWLERLSAKVAAHGSDKPLVVVGDFNVAPEERDVQNPSRWDQSTLFHVDARQALARVTGRGLVDAYRLKVQDPGKYSWWDYRMLAFPKNDGLRIDHVFVTPPVAARVAEAAIDREQRKGKQPSDHAPVVVTLAD